MSEFLDQLRAQAAVASFPEEGELAISGARAPIEIGRDRWGVPYIRAETQDDLWFAQGVFTAGERLFQLDLVLRAANGRLSEVFADRTLAEDRFARTVGINRAGARLAKDWDEASRAMHGRFREGVFAWIEVMPAAPVEYSLLDLSPDLPGDEASWAAAFSYLAWSLSGNWDHELLRTWIAERAGEAAMAALLPPVPEDPPNIATGFLHGRTPDLLKEILESMPRNQGQGSNAWVVSGERTATGKPMLANDPHLLALQPGPWLECHLSAPGYQTRGVALLFSPGVLLGTTAHHAWGATNVSGDVQDLYIERLNEDRTASEYDGEWEPLTVHREEIAVRGSEPVVLDVAATRHGPLIGSFVSGRMSPEHVELGPTENYSLAWTGADHGIHPSLAVEAASAGSFEEFREAALGVTCPGQNFVYADVDGTIGYVCTGRFPVRKAGDGTVPVPGWSSEFGWNGSIPPDELPMVKNPERGYLATANNRMHDPGYPHLIGHDFHASYRARRIGETLAGASGMSLEDMADLQNDTLSIPALEVLPMLLKVEASTQEQAEAIDRLRSWDADMAADSQPAALFNVWCRSIARRFLEPLLGEDLARHYISSREIFQTLVLKNLLGEAGPWRQKSIDDDLLLGALDDALTYLSEAGEAGLPTWGEIHRLKLAHPLASIPGLTPLFMAADIPFGGDEQTVMAGGFDGRYGYAAAVIPSWRAVYDLADLDRSVGVLPTGNSGNPASSHWNDQTELYSSGGYHEMPFTQKAVDAATVATLRLVSYHP